jgi:hypothetical protein
LWQYLVWQEQKQLQQLLATKPLQFRKRLKEIDQLVASSDYFTAEKVIELVSGTKVPPLGYRYAGPQHRELRSVASLLMSNQNYGLKTGGGWVVLDWDPPTDALLRAEQLQYLQALIRLLKPWQVVQTPSGGYHLYLSTTVALASGKLYYRSKATGYQSLVAGDFQAQGKYVVGGFSAGYQVVKLDLKRKEEVVYQTREEIEALLKQVGFSFSIDSPPVKLAQTNSLAPLVHSSLPEEENFLSTMQPATEILPAKRLVIDFAPPGFTYQGEQQLSAVQVLSLASVVHRGWEKQKGGSRDPKYYQAMVQAVTGQSYRFLVDGGYRKREFSCLERAVQSQSLVQLTLRQGERHAFLERIVAS